MTNPYPSQTWLKCSQCDMAFILRRMCSRQGWIWVWVRDCEHQSAEAVVETLGQASNLSEYVMRVVVLLVRDGWRLVLVGSNETIKIQDYYSTEAAAEAAGQHLIGQMMP